MVLLLVTSVIAAVVIRQDVTTNPSVVASDVVFANGENYTSINTFGFATVTLGSSGTSATLAVNGVAGVADLQLNGLLNLTNQDGSQGYSVTLVRSAAPVAAIDEFTLHVKDSADDSSVVSWDASASASSSAFSLPAGSTYDISLDYLVADGTATGALTSFTIQFQLTPE